MFDTKKFGVYMARNRKNADLTQSELAEKLCLTRQAISRYELGDSFPDISILIQIAEIFEVTLDELINSGNPTKGETKMIKNIIDINEKNTIKIDDIINVAPLIKPSALGEFAKKLEEDGINISHIVSLVQYLKDDDILQMINSANYNSLNEELIERIIPFLDTASKELMLKKIIEGESDWHLIKALLPHMENAVQQLEAAVMDGALPSETLNIMSEYFWKGRLSN